MKTRTRGDNWRRCGYSSGIVRRAWRAVAFEIGGTCYRDFIEHGDASSNHRAVGETAHAQYAVHTFAHEIY